MDDKGDLIKFDNGNVYMWIEFESSIMLKAAVKEFNDPVELTVDEARIIAKSLLALADKLDNLNSSM